MLQKNPNYNPNDPSSNRYITKPTTPTTIGGIFSNIAAPFKNITTPKPNPVSQVTPLITPKKPTPVNNMSIAPVYPTPSGQKPGTVSVQKTIPNPVIPSQPGTTIKTNIPVATPSTPTTNANLPKTETGEIDYNALAKSAGAAGLSMQEYLGLVEAGATPGTKEMDTIYNDLGIPDLVSEVYAKPSKTTQSIYEDYYNKSELGNIKSKVAELDTELKTIRDGYTTAVKEHQDNPWLSASTRSAKIAREKELYGQREANSISLRQSYLDQYDQGVNEIEKTIERVGGDLEFDRSLNADKLNYLLNEAERKAGLNVADKTKEGVRYSGSYLTSRRNEKLNEENRAYSRQVALKKMDQNNDLVGAISKLSSTNPQAGGYFNALNNILAIKDSTPEKSKMATSTLTNYLQNGNTDQAREYLQQLALGGLSGTAKDDAMKRTQSINALTNIKAKLNDYSEKYGDTNILTGTIQNIQQNLGTAGNPDAAKLNSELTNLLQQARVNVTGAAWGNQETKEYEKLNANIKNTKKLNLALIDSNLEVLNRNNASSIEWILGKDTYNQLYRPPTTQVTANTTLPSFYSKADTQTKQSIDKMILDGLPEKTILELFK